MARKSKTKSSSKTARAVGKGFYIALAVCVLAVGGMAVNTFTDTMRTDKPSTVFTTAAPTAVTTSVSPAAVSPATTVTTTTVTVLTTTVAEAPVLSKVWPMGQEIAAAFSETPVYSETMEDYRSHIGVDFVGEDGQTVCAAAAGTIAKAEEDALWNGSLFVDHGDGMISIYRGIDPTVQEGDTVNAGDPIGVLLGVPCEQEDSPHLHLELMKNGETIDPLSWLKTDS